MAVSEPAGTGSSLSRLGVGDPVAEARLLLRVIETMSAGLDLDEILHSVARLMTETTDTDLCFVHLVDVTRRRLQLRGATPPFDKLVGQVELQIGEGLAGWVAAHGRPGVIIDDKLSDPRYRYIPELRGEEYVSVASVPIFAGQTRLVGVLNVHTKERREFTDADVELLSRVAGLIAGAIENARLYGKLAEREDALEQYAERIVRLQENERRRLSGEIHDGISQRIVSLSFHLSAALDVLDGDGHLVGTHSAADQIRRAHGLAEAALEETRYAIAGLRPPVLDDLGLAASLESLAKTVGGPDVRVEADTRRLAEHVETAIYRVAQEALQNIAKHASARSVTVRLSVTEESVLLEVIDDGVGFDPQRAGPREGPGGYGLTGMAERAELLGGQLTIDSRPGEGTRLQLSLPGLSS
jgi:signal transduction histidine kinase